MAALPRRSCAVWMNVPSSPLQGLLLRAFAGASLVVVVVSCEWTEHVPVWQVLHRHSVNDGEVWRG